MAPQPPAPQPWEQRPGESAQAYAAFLAYRDLGAHRSIDAAAAQVRGAPAGQRGGNARATGCVTGWSAKHEWTARVRAWDAHHAAIRQSAMEKAEASSAERWFARRDEALEDEWVAGRQLMRQAKLVASMPVLDTEKTEAGVVTRITAVPPETLKAAAAIARVGAALARGAVDAALGIQPAPASTAPPVAPDLAESQRRLDAWKAMQRQRMLTLPTPGAGTAPEPPAPERNGSHAPPTPASST